MSGLPYHVNQRRNHREPVSFNHGDYAGYLDLISKAAEASGTEIWAYRLMPNHVHFIMTPSHEEGLYAPTTGTLATRFSSRAFGSRTEVMFQGRQVLFRVSLLAVAGVFTLLALSPRPVGLANDKLDHFAAFLVLGLMARLTFPAQGAVLTGLCLSLFGAGLEVLQGLPFIQRDSDIGDWAADLAGIALAILITWAFSGSRRRPAPQ